MSNPKEILFFFAANVEPYLVTHMVITAMTCSEKLRQACKLTLEYAFDYTTR